MDYACPGCRKGADGLCAECEALARAGVSVSRSLWSTWAALALVPVIIGATVWLLWEVQLRGRGLGAILVLAAIAVGALVDRIRWSWRTPLSLEIRDGIARITWPGRRRRDVPLERLESRLGNLHDLETGEQWPVRGIRYPDAERFHCALRAGQWATAANS